MYAGFITSKYTADWLGAHQKFNKVAYRLTLPYVDYDAFPQLEKIQHFEGYNGPDGIKVKSPHRHEEPSHFYDPESGQGELLEHISNHYNSLAEALSLGDMSRAAFEAAWLSHSIVDGLTPAHHYPYEDELMVMYEAARQEFRKRRHKVWLQGDSRRQMLRHNWQMWGHKGLLSTHILFETGVAAAIVTSGFKENINPAKLIKARREQPLEFFKQQATAIHKLRLYDEFYRSSWTVGLARKVRYQLAPEIIQTVAIMWVLAAEEAGLGR